MDKGGDECVTSRARIRHMKRGTAAGYGSVHGQGRFGKFAHDACPEPCKQAIILLPVASGDQRDAKLKLHERHDRQIKSSASACESDAMTRGSVLPSTPYLAANKAAG